MEQEAPGPENQVREQVDLPPYGGSADHGIAGSVPPQDPAAGDVVDVVRSSHETLQRLLDEVDGLLHRSGGGPDPDAPDPLAHDAASSAAVVGGWRGRWPGVVRALLEQLDAEGRVAWPAVESGAAQTLDRSRSLSADLREVDGIDLRDVDPGQVATLVTRSRDELRALDEALLPRLEALPADRRAALGEDLRQVLG
jgi:hypothetical protein